MAGSTILQMTPLCDSPCARLETIVEDAASVRKVMARKIAHACAALIHPPETLVG
jgi:hypothetical protein